MRYIIILLFLLNFILGLSFINEGLFHYDSVLLAQAVEKTYEKGLLQPSSRGRYGAVIINLIIYYPFFLFGQNADFALRFSSVLFHSLSIVVLFYFINELFNDRLLAFFVSLLFSFTPFYFVPNTYGKEHGLSMFILLLSLYLLYAGLNKKSPILVSISSFLVAFSTTVRESMLMAIPLYFLLYLKPEISIRPFKVTFLQERFNLKWISAATVPLIIVFCFVFFIYLRSEIYNYIFITNYATTVNFTGLFSKFLLQALKDLFISIPVLMFVFFLLGILKMIWDKKIFISLFFIFWLLLIFYFGNQKGYCPRYLEIITIPVYVFASYVLAVLYRKSKSIAICIIIYCIAYMGIVMYPLLIFRHHYNGEKQFALYVNEKTEPNAIVIAMDDSPFIEYYGKRKTITYPIDSQDKINNFIKRIDAYLNDNAPVYLISSSFSYDAGGNFKKILSENFDLTLIGKKLTEDYHRPELKFQFYYEQLFKVSPVRKD